jgi:hypothetical protein
MLGAVLSFLAPQDCAICRYLHARGIDFVGVKRDTVAYWDPGVPPGSRHTLFHIIRRPVPDAWNRIAAADGVSTYAAALARAGAAT